MDLRHCFRLFFYSPERIEHQNAHTWYTPTRNNSRCDGFVVNVNSRGCGTLLQGLATIDSWVLSRPLKWELFSVNVCTCRVKEVTLVEGKRAYVEGKKRGKRGRLQGVEDRALPPVLTRRNRKFRAWSDRTLGINSKAYDFFACIDHLREGFGVKIEIPLSVQREN